MCSLTPSAPELVALSPPWAGPLADFFADLQAGGDGRWFHPHPLTNEEAENRCRYQGEDFYGVMHCGRRILAYGMLRGWEEGFAVPSVGLAVHPLQHGRGFGRTMLEWLHCVARFKRAERARLTVHRNNDVAIRLYASVGYRFSALDSDRLVGVVNLLSTRKNRKRPNGTERLNPVR